MQACPRLPKVWLLSPAQLRDGLYGAFDTDQWTVVNITQRSTTTTAPILGTILGEQNTYDALAGRTPSGPVTFGRISTDDRNGRIAAYVGEGRFTDDPLKAFGTRAVVEVPELQKLIQVICRRGFEHHAAMNASRSAGVLAEAMENYLGWDVYVHGERATPRP